MLKDAQQENGESAPLFFQNSRKIHPIATKLHRQQWALNKFWTKSRDIRDRFRQSRSFPQQFMTALVKSIMYASRDNKNLSIVLGKQSGQWLRFSRKLGLNNQ